MKQVKRKVNNAVLQLLIKSRNIPLWVEWLTVFLKANNDTESQSNPFSVTAIPCLLIASIQQINLKGFCPI